MTKKVFFRRHYNERLTELPVHLRQKEKRTISQEEEEEEERNIIIAIHNSIGYANLSPQYVEEISRSCDIHNLPITLSNLFQMGWIHLRNSMRIVINHLSLN